MSKFLLNLLLQISKALVNSKIQFLIRKFFFLISARPTLRPTRPLAQPAHWPRHPRRLKPSLAGPTSPCVGHVFARNTSSLLIRAFRAGRLSLVSLTTGPQLSAPSSTSNRPSSPAPPPLPGHRAPPSSTPRVPPDRYHLAFISPCLNPLLNPPPSSMALKPLTPALNSPATLPGAPPAPYKRRAPPPSFTAPLPAPFPLSPRLSSPLTEHRRRQTFTTVAHPPRRRPSPGEAIDELPMCSSLCCAPARTPLSAPPSVHGGSSAPGLSTEAWTRSTDLSVEK
jgi:hypothetical protein